MWRAEQRGDGEDLNADIMYPTSSWLGRTEIKSTVSFTCMVDYLFWSFDGCIDGVRKKFLSALMCHRPRGEQRRDYFTAIRWIAVWSNQLFHLVCTLTLTDKPNQSLHVLLVKRLDKQVVPNERCRWVPNKAASLLTSRITNLLSPTGETGRRYDWL